MYAMPKQDQDYWAAQGYNPASILGVAIRNRRAAAQTQTAVERTPKVSNRANEHRLLAARLQLIGSELKGVAK